MSKLVYVCPRNPANRDQIIDRLVKITSKILPDNITPKPSKVIDHEGILFGLYNPNPAVSIKGANICLGNIFEEDRLKWHLMDQKPPDGTYAIFRGDKDKVQILTDVVASRSIWYFFDDEMFISSTSQRAITLLLGNFDYNENVIPWMLTTGTTGPELCWDKRIKLVAGDSMITLNRSTWMLTENIQALKFQRTQASDQEHETILKNALYETFNQINLDYSQWILLLSGGIDSRSILTLLKNKEGLKSITWGIQSSLQDKKSDAYIANQLALSHHISNEFFETDIGEKSISTLLNRYLVCGEGRIDHLSGYMDGFEIWKKLYNGNINGIIRGDEGFGWIPVSSPLEVRLSVGIPLWADFSNLPDLKKFGFSNQQIPGPFMQANGESNETWRDRLYHQFRIPYVLGALSDLKLPFVEIINPLLSRKIIHAVRGLPDHLRTGKVLYKKIVTSIIPKDIKYADHQAVENKRDILKNVKVLEFLRNELKSSNSNGILPQVFINYVIGQTTFEQEVQRPSQQDYIKKYVKPFLPVSIIRGLKSTISKPKMDFNVLAFRAFMICRMITILKEDAIL